MARYICHDFVMEIQPLLVGIAGGSGSGKTYFAHQIANALGRENAEVLSMDQYFLTPADGVDKRDINFDHPAHLDLALLTEHLTNLKRGEAVLTPKYDFATMRRLDGESPMGDKPVIIVEGLFVLASPFSLMLDILIFLDVDADQRLLGRILRDVRERGATTEELVDRYQRFVRPSYNVFVEPTKQNADLVADFTFRRIFLTELVTGMLHDYISGRVDVAAFKERMREECHHLGFTPRDGSMPITVDLFELSKVFPESVSTRVSMQ